MSRLNKGERIAAVSGMALLLLTFAAWVKNPDESLNAWQLFRILDILYALLALTPLALASLKVAGVRTPPHLANRDVLVTVGTVLLTATASFLLENPSLGLLLAALAAGGILYGGMTTPARSHGLSARQETLPGVLAHENRGERQAGTSRWRGASSRADEAGTRDSTIEVSPSPTSRLEASESPRRKIFFAESAGSDDLRPHHEGLTDEPSRRPTVESLTDVAGLGPPAVSPEAHGMPHQRIFYTESADRGAQKPGGERASPRSEEQPMAEFEVPRRPQHEGGIDGFVQRAISTGSERDAGNAASPEHGLMHVLEQASGQQRVIDQLEAELEGTTSLDSFSVLNLARDAAERVDQVEVRTDEPSNLVLAVRKGSKTVASFEVETTDTGNTRTRFTVEWTGEMLQKVTEALETIGWVEGLYWSRAKGVPGFRAYSNYLEAFARAVEEADPSARTRKS